MKPEKLLNLIGVSREKGKDTTEVQETKEVDTKEVETKEVGPKEVGPELKAETNIEPRKTELVHKTKESLKKLSYRNKVKTKLQNKKIEQTGFTKNNDKIDVEKSITKFEKSIQKSILFVKIVVALIVVAVIISILPINLNSDKLSSGTPKELAEIYSESYKEQTDATSSPNGLTETNVDNVLPLAETSNSEVPGGNGTAEIVNDMLQVSEQATINYAINRKITEIGYKEAYSVKEGNYLVLFTHEDCAYCGDLWEDIQKIYSEDNAKFESLPNLYVVDLKDPSNATAWTEYQLEGIPLILKFGDKVEKFVGSKESQNFLKELK